MFRRLLAPGPVFLDVGALLLRFWLGGFMLTHGVGKLLKLVSGDFNFPDPLGLGSTLSLVLAVSGEFVGSIFILLGLCTRIAALPYLITMLVAGFVVHTNDPFSKKELPFSFAIGAMVLLSVGPGRFSVDSALTRR